ncbi:hypothetical protein HYG81_23340 (plasmid) [Natrinema zhouii]|uniref:hypothetical protein n=1 Tax=Natrinema zhouii TaxID=1710539 RepID=UPI001CFFBFCA|nr:hypothetical protein [Natrinema zhouii]UHQ98512.1 hypothetical protein HYG81_23340 [Natrinema zhouii]
MTVSQIITNVVGTLIIQRNQLGSKYMAKSDHYKRVHAALNRALNGITFPSEDYTRLRTWVNEELPQLQAAGYTSYMVFGSYRGTYHESLRIVQYELAKPATVTAVVLGDTPELGLTLGNGRTDPFEFTLKFHLLTEFADQNVGIYEKDSGGEAVELALLNQEPCFSKTTVLPRDYYGIGTTPLESEADVKETARHIAFADDLDADAKKAELRGLLQTARDNGVAVTEHQLTEFLDDELAKRGRDDPTYSWVHLALFRHFEEVNRCQTWHREDDLRTVVGTISAESSPRWDVDLNPENR